ncbi:PP0621 family protein [Ramlibacter alkalitolerans]|jgi:uncharacterized protein|uniref:Preprotein translocase subunit YajC n=1 Tax=Ramlibacter alkalitolerans TaxID=2039631 RepID=A0ABS1JSX6_9BURK|nr:PP0621 family protein [Ramlibacter alkalitolerans]MBL0427342.1 hypothetical protein [Ramlibacter alkalitolerans]
MKYLLLIVLLFVAYTLWRNARIRDDRESRPPPPPPPRRPGDPQEMVSCPVCGVHLPRSEAVPGAGGLLYCSNEHRLRAGG